MRELAMISIVDRLRANLRAAGVAVGDTDIDAMVEGGYLKQVLAFEEAAEGREGGQTPDYLDGMGSDPSPADPGPAGGLGGGAGSDPGPGPAGGLAGRAAEPSGPRGAAPAAARGVDILSLGIDALAGLLAAGELSPVELVEESLARSRGIGESLNAFQVLLEDGALAAARDAERELRAGARRGPLHGIPVAVKDLLDVAGAPTRAGSIILGGTPAAADSRAVARLRAAGAVIVGKTRLPEFAFSPGSNNDHYGPVRNPRDPERDSGGSSSGSAAAVAAGIVPAALGTDSGGSIRIPAAFCGLVGLKPTFGRLSLAGAVPLAWSCDHLGPLARSVRDAAIMLDALEGPDPAAPRPRATTEAPFAPALSRRASAGASRPLAGIRVGVLREDGSGRTLGTEEVLSAWRAGLAALEAAGAELVETDLPELKAARALNSTLIAIEAIAFHAPLMRARHADYGEFPRLRLLAGFAYSPEDFVRAQRARADVRRRCTAIFERVDLLSTPTTPREAPPLGSVPSIAFTSPFNLLGWPAISLPAGKTAAGLPLGMQLAARPWDEARLLAAAAAAETVLGLYPQA